MEIHKRSYIMSDYIHMTHGKAHQREELLRMLDVTFDFDKGDTNFLKLLPKLYKEQYFCGKLD